MEEQMAHSSVNVTVDVTGTKYQVRTASLRTVCRFRNLDPSRATRSKRAQGISIASRMVVGIN